MKKNVWMSKACKNKVKDLPKKKAKKSKSAASASSAALSFFEGSN
jgi:hypothetical protein